MLTSDVILLHDICANNVLIVKEYGEYCNENKVRDVDNTVESSQHTNTRQISNML